MATFDALLALQALQSFWADLNAATPELDEHGGDEWADLIRHASAGMDYLGNKASSADGEPSASELEVRKALVQAQAFETALAVEMKFSSALGHWIAAGAAPGGRNVPTMPHQTLLEWIVKSNTDGWLQKGDPTGVMLWISDPQRSAVALAGVLKQDPSPGAVGAALALLRDSALPAVWPQVLLGSQAFETLAERLPHTVWSDDSDADLSARTAIQALGEQAQARMQTLAAVAGGPTLPSITLANGSTAQMFSAKQGSPPSISIKGPVISGLVLGFLGGAAYAISRHRRK